MKVKILFTNNYEFELQNNCRYDFDVLPEIFLRQIFLRQAQNQEFGFGVVAPVKEGLDGFEAAGS